MPKFAVCYIPEENSDLYKRGTEILGYDIRKKKRVDNVELLKAKFGDFDESWVKKARVYGLHCTIGDAIEYNPATISLDAVAKEVKKVLNCFDPKHHFVLQKAKDFVVFGEPPKYWGNHLCAIRYDTNDYFKILETLIVAAINRLGTGSGYLDDYNADANIYGAEYYKASRTKYFYADSLFDDYEPHFTLLHPYTGPVNNIEKIRVIINKIFSGNGEIVLKSICLLCQKDMTSNYEIFEEFELYKLHSL